MKKSLYLKESLKGEKATLKDLKDSERVIIKYVQNKYFGQEIDCMSKCLKLPIISKLRKLNPFVDDHGIIRVGGRLKHSICSFEVKHPIIIPSCFIAEILVKDVHAKVGHLGRESILSYLRRNYWVVKGNSLARKVVSNCTLCKKIQGRPCQQLMSDLPEIRVQGDNPVFSNTGEDYFGPFHVVHGRKN